MLLLLRSCKYTEADQYGSTVIAGKDAQKDVGEETYNPFDDLKAMMNKKKWEQRCRIAVWPASYEIRREPSAYYYHQKL